MKPPVRRSTLAIQAVACRSARFFCGRRRGRGTARGLWAQRRVVGRRIAAISALTVSAVTFWRASRGRHHGHRVSSASSVRAGRVPRRRAGDVARGRAPRHGAGIAILSC
jgi:hypothetical protein